MFAASSQLGARFGLLNGDVSKFFFETLKRNVAVLDDKKLFDLRVCHNRRMFLPIQNAATFRATIK